jgi:hypothetical protein
MSKIFWIRLVFALPAAIAVQVLLRQWVNLLADVGSVGAFVTAIGTLYSVLGLRPAWSDGWVLPSSRRAQDSCDELGAIADGVER